MQLTCVFIPGCWMNYDSFSYFIGNYITYYTHVHACIDNMKHSLVHREWVSVCVFVCVLDLCICCVGGGWRGEKGLKYCFGTAPPTTPKWILNVLVSHTISCYTQCVYSYFSSRWIIWLRSCGCAQPCDHREGSVCVSQRSASRWSAVLYSKEAQQL